MLLWTWCGLAVAFFHVAFVWSWSGLLFMIDLLVLLVTVLVLPLAVPESISLPGSRLTGQTSQ